MLQQLQRLVNEPGRAALLPVLLRPAGMPAEQVPHRVDQGGDADHRHQPAGVLRGDEACGQHERGGGHRPPGHREREVVEAPFGVERHEALGPLLQGKPRLCRPGPEPAPAGGMPQVAALRIGQVFEIDDGIVEEPSSQRVVEPARPHVGGNGLGIGCGLPVARLRRQRHRRLLGGGGRHRRRCHGADEQPVQAGGVDPDEGIGLLVGDVGVDVAGGEGDDPPGLQQLEGIDERRTLTPVRHVEAVVGTGPGGGLDAGSQDADRGQRVPGELGAEQACQLVAAPVEWQLAAPDTVRRAGGVRAGRSLGQTGETAHDVDGELPPARRLEPLRQPPPVAGHHPELDRRPRGVDDGSGKEHPDPERPLRRQVVVERPGVSHRPPPVARGHRRREPRSGPGGRVRT